MHHLFTPGGHEDDIWRAEEGDQSSDGEEHEVKLSNQAVLEIFKEDQLGVAARQLYTFIYLIPDVLNVPCIFLVQPFCPKYTHLTLSYPACPGHWCGPKRPKRGQGGRSSTSNSPPSINTTTTTGCENLKKRKTAWEICNLFQKCEILNFLLSLLFR